MKLIPLPDLTLSTAVGKTSIISRFVDDSFRDETATIGEEFREKTIRPYGLKVDVKILIADTVN